MEIYVIYKKTFDNSGNITKIDIVEFDEDETTARSFTKLYNLQIPLDMRNNVVFENLHTSVI